MTHLHIGVHIKTSFQRFASPLVKNAFSDVFFPKIMPESWGCGFYISAAYTQVFTVYPFVALH